MNILLYRKDCLLCVKAIKEAAEFFSKRNQPLVVHRWSSDYRVVTGLPAIVVRKETFNTDQEVVIVGSQLIDTLEYLAANEVK